MSCKLLFILSLLAFAGGVTAVLFARKTGRSIRIQLGYFILGVFTAEYFVTVAYLRCMTEVGWTAWFSAVTMSLQMFSLDAPYTELIGFINEYIKHDFPRVVGLIYVSVLNITAPFAGGAIILDAIMKLFPSLKLWWCRNRRLYVFSELNARTIILAEDIAGNMEKERKKRFSSREKGKRRPKCAIVFTDAYIDNEVEQEAELMQRAKHLGAICVRDDLMSCRSLWKCSQCNIFLMDMNGEGEFHDSKNLSAYSKLLGAEYDGFWEHKFDSFVYIFSGSNDVADTVRSIKKEFNKRCCMPDDARDLGHPVRALSRGDEGFEEMWQREADYYIHYDEVRREYEEKALEGLSPEERKAEQERLAKSGSKTKLIVKLVRDYAQCCIKHLCAVPMYETLKEPEDAEPSADPRLPPKPSRELHVVIFGNTPFSREMLKTVFWCGQLLHTRLAISVVYTRSPGYTGDVPELMSELNGISPEILESCRPDGDCLRVYASDPDFRMPPYCRLSFIEQDVTVTPLMDLLCADRPDAYTVSSFGDRERFRLCDANYFLVMGKNDGENISLTAELQRCLSRVVLRNGKNAAGPKPLISYVVEDDVISEATDVLFSAGDVKVHAFGGLKTRFSLANVSLDDEYLLQSLNSDTEEMPEITASDLDFMSDMYSWWSSSARTAHLGYAIWSAGCPSSASQTDRKLDYIKKVTGYSFRVLDVKNKRLWADTHDAPAPEEPESRETISQRKNDLAWLEHRRWCAFMRTQGFSCPTDEEYEEYSSMADPLSERGEVLACKNLLLLLHPCIVECDCRGVRPLDYSTAESGSFPEDYDRLDIVNIRRSYYYNKYMKPKKKKAYQCKVYDFPDGEHLPYFSRGEILAFLGIIDYRADSDYGAAAVNSIWSELVDALPALEKAMRLSINGDTPLMQKYRYSIVELDRVLDVLSEGGKLDITGIMHSIRKKADKIIGG